MFFTMAGQMRKAVIFFTFIFGCFVPVFGQTCTANANGGGSNTYNASTGGIWTASGGATCPPTSTFTGNVVINVGGNDRLIWNYALNMTGDMTITLANGSVMEYNANVNVTGNVPMTNTGSSTLQVNTGVAVHVIAGVNGDMGDPDNNNVTFIVNGSGSLEVDGTLSAKNGAVFSGTGTISGGLLEIGNGGTCGTPCPVTGGFTGCTAGDAFCTTNLPIVLSYFNVSLYKDEQRVLLEWATESEENFDHFEIQRAGSDLKFVSIVNVPGAGYNTNSLQQYVGYDNTPLVGNGYYRLKAVDIDGSVEYFKIKSINYNGGKRFGVYPNPANGLSIKYAINFEPTSHDRVVLVDAVGNELFSAAVTATENELIPDKALPSGVYLLRYISSTYQQVARVFIKD